MKSKRIVIKVGSNVLIGSDGRLSRSILESIVDQCVWCLSQGWQVALVTSGAVATGKEIAHLQHIREEAIQRQVYAAIGQVDLMILYRDLFRKRGVTIAQALLTKDDFSNRLRFLNVSQTFNHSLENGVIPIINENDVITTHESTFGDNDALAANTALTIYADKLVLLTNIDGLYTADPAVDSNAVFVPAVENIDEEIAKMASTTTSTLGIGGMLSKIQAAQIATRAGITTYIANGKNLSIVKEIIEGKAKATEFFPQLKKMNQRDRWMMSGKNSLVTVRVDAGAERALRRRKSLLLVGVKDVEGTFEKNTIVQIANEKKEIIGYGRSAFSSDEIVQRLVQKKTKGVEIFHANNIFIF